jgi:hypothetical protein
MRGSHPARGRGQDEAALPGAARRTSITPANAVEAIYPAHPDAEAAVKNLRQTGYDIGNGVTWEGVSASGRQRRAEHAARSRGTPPQSSESAPSSRASVRGRWARVTVLQSKGKATWNSG